MRDVVDLCLSVLNSSSGGVVSFGRGGGVVGVVAMSTQDDRRRRRETRAAERAVASQHDQENEMSQQNTEQRRALRSKYRQIKQDIADGAEELGRLDSNRFYEVVERMDDLHQEVQKPREQIADAEAVMNLTNGFLCGVKASNRKIGTSPATFVGAILATFGTRTIAADDESPVEIDWGTLGLAAIGFFREAPGVATMLGPMDIEPKVRQAHVPRPKRVRPTEATRAEEVRDQCEAAARAETDSNMETMFNILRKVKRARLDALVLNRESFSQTVENIFSLSFLVKDGRVAISHDNDGTHFVAPKNAPTTHDRQSGKVANKQFVFRYDWTCWKTMQENLEAGTELMPDRLHASDSLSQPSQGTPIRKISRNRGRQSRKANGSDDEDDEAHVEVEGRRNPRRNRTSVDQFR